MQNQAQTQAQSTALIRTGKLAGKPAFCPRTTAKALSGLTVSAIIAGITGTVPDAEMLRPSAIRMTDSAAKAAIGGKMDGTSLIGGLVYSLARYSHGKRLDSIVDGLPAFAVHALETGAALLPFGPGATAGAIRAAAAAAVAAIAALPSKAPAAVVAPAEDAIDGEVTARTVGDAPASEEAAPLSPAALREGVAMLGGPLDNVDALAHGEAAIAAEQAAADAAVAAAEQRAAQLAQVEAWAAQRAADALVEKHIAAREMRRLADGLGIKLTAAQLKALAAVEAAPLAA